MSLALIRIACAPLMSTSLVIYVVYGYRWAVAVAVVAAWLSALLYAEQTRALKARI